MTPEQKLSRHLRLGLSYPIVERAISPSIDTSIRGEIRAVMARYNGEILNLFSYSKTSSDPVAANRSMGGGSERIEDTLERLFSSNTNLRGDNLQREIDREKKLLSEMCIRFAERLFAETERLGVSCAPFFSIDLYPIWDKTAQIITYWKVEIQEWPMTEGAMKLLPPEVLARAGEIHADLEEQWL